MRIALYQPDIAGNVGTLLRLGACMGVPVDLIEPMGFQWDDKRVARAAMDYIDHVEVARHADWDGFAGQVEGRLVLLTTRGATPMPSIWPPAPCIARAPASATSSWAGA